MHRDSEHLSPTSDGLSSQDNLRAEWHVTRYRLKVGLLVALLFGLVVNVLQLAVPLFSMQIFERVLPSGQIPTLTSLTLIVLLIACLSALIDGSRSSILVKTGNIVCRSLDSPAHRAAISAPALTNIVQDLDVIRSFLSGPICAALLDAPWSVVYLLILGLIDPVFAVYTAAAFSIVFGVGLLGYFILLDKREILYEHESQVRRLMQFAAVDGAELVGAGAIPGILAVLTKSRTRGRWAFSELNVTQAWLDAFARSIRVVLQVGLLALAATLTVIHRTDAGAIIASSMLFSRGLSPIERLSMHIKTLQTIHMAWKRINSFAWNVVPDLQKVRINDIKGSLRLQHVTVVFPGTHVPALANITFHAPPGSLLVVVGTEGAGKSTLARILCGSLVPSSGKLTLDNMNFGNYSLEQLSELIGYLADFPCISSKSVAHFIRREGRVDDDATVSAAAKVGLDELIRSLPLGYQTSIGPGAWQLSAGTAKRLALARAIYKTPRIVILDEPLLGLDPDGEAYVLRAIQELKCAGSTVVAICKSAHLLHVADAIVMLDRGHLRLTADDEKLKSFVGPKTLTSA